MNQTVLILADIHLKHKLAQRIIDSVEHDLTVFLGDAFHDFNDTPEKNVETACWLKDKLADPTFIALWGNHDICTAFLSEYTVCSGWSRDKQTAIDGVMQNEDWQKFRSFYYVPEGNWLLSHAGIARPLFECPQRGLTLEVIQERCDRGLASLAYKQFAPEFAAGYERGGSQAYGGVTWQDFRNLLPIKEFRQVMGHTPFEQPQVRFANKNDRIFQRTYDRFNGWKTHPELAIGLDTHLRHYGILKDGKLSIHETKSP